MAGYLVIRPEDDSDALRASEWCDDLKAGSSFQAHTCVHDVDSNGPVDEMHILAALGTGAELVLYFGHGNERSWTTSNITTVDMGNVTTAVGKAVVSIACKTSCLLGPAAITGGVVAWLGFTTRVPIIDKHKGADPIGEALVRALSNLGAGCTMDDAHDAVVSEFEQLVVEFDSGSLTGLYITPIGYYGSMAMRDNCVVNGRGSHQPMV